MAYRRLANEKVIKKVIRRCLSTDLDLVKNRHHSPIKTVSGCVNYTYDTLFKDFDGSDIAFYELLEKTSWWNRWFYNLTRKNIYGFVAINHKQNCIRSFFINKNKRQNGYHNLFWKDVRCLVDKGFFIVVWSDNDRAERFFINEGGTVHYRNEGVLIYYFY